jgi:hypothetical protein
MERHSEMCWLKRGCIPKTKSCELVRTLSPEEVAELQSQYLPPVPRTKEAPRPFERVMTQPRGKVTGLRGIIR